MFKGLNYEFGTNITFIATDYYSGGGANVYSRWYKNGVLLTEPADYNTNYSQYGVNSINGLTPFNTGDVFRLELYDTIQDYLTPGINNGNGTIYEFDEYTILPRFSYLETYSPHANGITSTDTTDQSVVQMTPLTISKCSTTPINSHALTVIGVSNNRLFEASSLYAYGTVQLNGVDYTNSDVTNQSLQTGSFNFSSGVFSHDAVNIVLVKTTNTNSNILTYQHNGINTAADFAISINGIGFNKISSDNILNRYAFLGEDVNTNPQFATPTSLYSIEQTPTQYILRVDGSIVRTVNRSVVYSSTIGSVSDGSMLPLGTGVNYIADTAGTGYIEALMDGSVIARQVINVIDTPAPIFPSGSNSFSNICPASTFNLNSISTSNPQVGYTLKWYSDAALTNEITNTSLTTSQTVYASYESDLLASCNKVGTLVNITINNCANATDHSYVVPLSGIVLGNVSIGNTICGCIATVSMLPNLFFCVG